MTVNHNQYRLINISINAFMLPKPLAVTVFRSYLIITIVLLPQGPNLIFSRILLLSRAIFPPLFFFIVTLVIVRLQAKKISQLMRRFPANQHKLAYFDAWQNTILPVKSFRSKIVIFFQLCVLSTICYFEPNFVEIRLREIVRVNMTCSLYNLELTLIKGLFVYSCRHG